MPTPSSRTRISLTPPASISTSIRRAPASSAFSTSSFTTEAGRSTTSPAAIWLASRGDKRCMRLMRPQISLDSGMKRWRWLRAWKIRQDTSKGAPPASMPEPGRAGFGGAGQSGTGNMDHLPDPQLITAQAVHFPQPSDTDIVPLGDARQGIATTDDIADHLIGGGLHRGSGSRGHNGGPALFSPGQIGAGRRRLFKISLNAPVDRLGHLALIGFVRQQPRLTRVGNKPGFHQ